MKYFLTSRYGKLDSVKIYRYDFSNDLSYASKNKLCKWIIKNSDNHLYEMNDDYFILFNQIDTSAQYRFRSAKYIEAPYENTQVISRFLSKNLLNKISLYYEQFHYYNSIIIDNLVIEEFMLLKCIKFNIEVFQSGRFYIHLFPQSKIINSKPLTKKFFMKLQNAIDINEENVYVSLRIDKQRYKITVDLSEKESIRKLVEFIERNDGKKVFLTFNYRSLSQISPSSFKIIQSETQNIIDAEVEKIQLLASQINLDFGELYVKPFFAFKNYHPQNTKNLIVGGNRKVTKQSAAYHFGMYKGIFDTDIRPIFINDRGIEVKSDFYEKLIRYNSNGSGNRLIDPVCIKIGSIDNTFELPDSITKHNGRKVINAIFSQHQIPDDFFEAMYDDNHIFQIYVGRPQNYKIDNYTVKCLTKAGGILNVLDDINENVDTYFIGIDLGHSSDMSVVGLTLFSSNGVQLTTNTSPCELNEALDPFPLRIAMNNFRSYIENNNLPNPTKIIVHRDGKVHLNDIDRIINSALLIFDHLQKIEIVEIIKSGYPVVGCYDEGTYCLPKSGDYFIDRDEDYGILITNTQSNDNNERKILNPVIIKRKYGDTDFNILVEQVYWFTKVYTNNLYQSSRLPATTEKANNLVGTGLKRYSSSYLG